MLTDLSDVKNKALIAELTEGQDVGTIGGYCEAGFPIYYANDKMAHMLGYTDVEDLINGIQGKVANTIHPDDLERVGEELNHGDYYEGMTYKITYRMMKKDGSSIWTVDKGKVIRAEDGRLAIISICNDMTKFIDRHAELERRNQFSKSTLENMPGGYHRCAAEEGYPFLYISDRFCEMFGWTREEIRTEFDNKFTNMIHPDDAGTPEEYVDLLNQCTDKDVVDVIYRMRGKHGYIWVSDATSVVTVGDQTFYQGTLTDISNFVAEKRKQEELLREQICISNTLARNFKNVYRVNLKTGRAKALKIETDYVVLPQRDENQEFSYDALIQPWIDSLVYPDDREPLRRALSIQNLDRELSENVEFVGNYRSIATEGIHYYQYNASRMSADSGVVILGFQNIDAIIQEREIQEQELITARDSADRANAAKTEFLLRMSHDIRTPINGIMGMLDIADKTADDVEKQSDCRRKIREASGILLDLINEVLDMSKLESGEVQIEHVPFDLIRVSTEVYYAVKKQAEDRDIEIVQEDCSAEAARLIGSPLHLKRLMMNIVGNAVKYNKDHGKIFITCRESVIDENRVNLEFKCRDTGMGMSPEFMEHIFEPFTQENADARTKYGGTGLGMSITKSLVDKMGGTITVESVKGEGSIFDVIIPFEIDKSVPKATETEQNPERKSIKGMKILLAEDNELNMEIARFLLEEKGAFVTEAWNGRDAVDVFMNAGDDEIDAILMDVMMPIMDGYEATRRIRESGKPKAKTIPIIAMTANAFSEDRTAALNVGMNEHIAKPLETKKVVETIARLVTAYRKQK